MSANSTSCGTAKVAMVPRGSAGHVAAAPRGSTPAHVPAAPNGQYGPPIINLTGISADADNLLILGSDQKPFLSCILIDECLDGRFEPLGAVEDGLAGHVGLPNPHSQYLLLEDYVPFIPDHGTLTGLENNDHPQYLLVDDYDAGPFEAAGAVTAHVLEADPHTQYALESALGTAAVLNVGVSANNVVQLNGSAQLPAVDGSLLTNLPSGGTPGGSDTQVQFNDGGAFGGDAGLTYNKTTDVLTIAGRIVASYGTNNLAIGTDAGKTVSTGAGNIAIGYRAGELQNTHSYMTAIGYFAALNTTASFITAIGYLAAQKNLTGSLTAIGAQALQENTTGSFNIGIGYQALRSNATGSFSLAIGYQAGEASTGNSNLYLGYRAGLVHTGSSSVFIGSNAGLAETASHRLHIANTNTKSLLLGDFNLNTLAFGFTNLTVPTAAGDFAPSTTARASLRARPGVAPTSPNTGDLWSDGVDFYGHGAASYSFGAVVRTTAIRPLADSTTALQMQNAAGTAVVTVDTTNRIVYIDRGLGNGNTFIGGAGNNTLSSQYNIGIGTSALANLTSSQQNMGIGAFAFTNLQGGSRNTAVGVNCGSGLTSGQDNTIIGNLSGYRNQTGNQNTAIGAQALSGTVSTSASNNVGIGFQAGQVISTGANNTLIGVESGKALLSGASNVFLGYQAGHAETTISNRLHIANINTKSLILGDFNLNTLAFGFTDLTTGTAAGDFAPSTTARASLRLRNGVAPTSPNVGDMWSDGADFYGRGAASYSWGATVRTTKIQPLADSTNAFGLYRADGTTQDYFYDSVNGRHGFGSASSAGVLEVSGTAYPIAIINRISTGTTATKRVALGVRHTVTDSDMADGFGAGFTFEIRDNAGVDNPIAQIYAFRNGADNSGALSFWTYLAGTAAEAVVIQSDKKVAFSRGNATAVIDLGASTTDRASLRARTGVRPTSPNEGDLWTESDGWHTYFGGVEYILDMTPA